MQQEFWKSTGPTSTEKGTLEIAENITSKGLMSSAVEIPAKQTVQHLRMENERIRLEVSSSELLVNFVHELSSERTLPKLTQTRLGLGGECDAHSEKLATQFCPLDSERVVLGLTTDGIDCSCSPNYPTPRASMSSHGIAWCRARNGDHRSNLEDFLGWLHLEQGNGETPGLNANPEWIEWLMGFPIGHTDLKDLETQWCRK